MKRTSQALLFTLFLFMSAVFSSASVNAGNWYLQASSQTDASRIPQLGGLLTQTGSTISGVVHVSNSSCFEWVTDVPVSGVINGDNITLTSDSIEGQVITISGLANENALSGNYSIAGGCADGDRGSVSAVLVPPATGRWSGPFPSNGTDQSVVANFVQDAPNAGGYSALSGNLSFTGSPCFASGTLAAEQSWALGNLVQAVVHLNSGGDMALNGFITDASGNARQMTVNFSITGGKCSGQSGSVTFNRL